MSAEKGERHFSGRMMKKKFQIQQRRFSRISKKEEDIPVTLQTESGTSLNGWLKDISYQGVSVVLETDFDLAGRTITACFPEAADHSPYEGQVMKQEDRLLHIKLTALTHEKLLTLLTRLQRISGLR